MSISDKIQYIKLKDELSFSEFQMYVFLRVPELVDSYSNQTLQYTRTRLRPYLYDMEWYNAYVGHAQEGKEMWKE